MQIFLPKISCSKAILDTTQDLVQGTVNIPVVRSSPRQEYRIPLRNNSSISANCDFQILSLGFKDDMHTFFVIPFKAVIKPQESVLVTLVIKFNWKNYDKDEIDKRTEMRKLLNVKLIDSKVCIVVPLSIRFVSKSKEDTD